MMLTCHRTTEEEKYRISEWRYPVLQTASAKLSASFIRICRRYRMKKVNPFHGETDLDKKRAVFTKWKTALTGEMLE